VWGFASAQNQGATLKLGFHEILNIIKLVTVFETYASVDEAVKSFAKKV